MNRLLRYCLALTLSAALPLPVLAAPNNPPSRPAPAAPPQRSAPQPVYRPAPVQQPVYRPAPAPPQRPVQPQPGFQLPHDINPPPPKPEYRPPTTQPMPPRQPGTQPIPHQPITQPVPPHRTITYPIPPGQRPLPVVPLPPSIRTQPPGPIVSNPHHWHHWGWNHGVVWYPAPIYWGWGFWGPWAIGVTSGLVLYGSYIDYSDQQIYPSYQVQANSPGAQLLMDYGLTQTECGPPDLVIIWGPNNSVICAFPNDLVSAGNYQLDPATLTIESLGTPPQQ